MSTKQCILHVNIYIDAYGLSAQIQSCPIKHQCFIIISHSFVLINDMLVEYCHTAELIHRACWSSFPRLRLPSPQYCRKRPLSLVYTAHFTVSADGDDLLVVCLRLTQLGSRPSLDSSACFQVVCCLLVFYCCTYNPCNRRSYLWD